MLLLIRFVIYLEITITMQIAFMGVLLVQMSMEIMPSPLVNIAVKSLIIIHLI